VAAQPFSTTESTVGVAQVPDPRLTALAAMSKSKKLVPATLELVDIAGLVAGASTGEGLGNRFLAGIREVDAVVLVLRAFEDDNVVGGADALDDLHTLELELVLADVDSIESQLPKRQKMARADKSLAHEVAAMEAARRRSIRAADRLRGRRTFLTTADKESRAWTFRAGARAPECAGVIHSDLQRGFIRAEVIRWDELLELGSWNKAKEVGRLRVEGKDYEVADGDVLEIRFNVLAPLSRGDQRLVAARWGRAGCSGCGFH